MTDEAKGKDELIRELVVEATQLEPQEAARHVLQALALEFQDRSDDAADVDELASVVSGAAPDLAAAIVAARGEGDESSVA